MRAPRKERRARRNPKGPPARYWDGRQWTDRKPAGERDYLYEYAGVPNERPDSGFLPAVWLNGRRETHTWWPQGVARWEAEDEALAMAVERAERSSGDWYIEVRRRGLASPRPGTERNRPLPEKNPHGAPHAEEWRERGASSRDLWQTTVRTAADGTATVTVWSAKKPVPGQMLGRDGKASPGFPVSLAPYTFPSRAAAVAAANAFLAGKIKGTVVRGNPRRRNGGDGWAEYDAMQRASRPSSHGGYTWRRQRSGSGWLVLDPDGEQVGQVHASEASAERAARIAGARQNPRRRNPSWSYRPSTRELTAKGLVHLQGIGNVPGKPARDLRVGDVTLWNGGFRETVLAIEPKGKQSLKVTIRSEESGRTFERTLRRDRLVAVEGITRRAKKNPRGATARELFQHHIHDAEEAVAKRHWQSAEDLIREARKYAQEDYPAKWAQEGLSQVAFLSVLVKRKQTRHNPRRATLSRSRNR